MCSTCGWFTKPGVVEAALATRVVQDWEGPTLARAWHGVKAAAMTKPAIHAVSSWEQLSLAVPELTDSATGGADGDGEQCPLFLVEASYPQKKFGQQLAEAVGAVKVTQF